MQLTLNSSILLVGCGRMGSAMLSGWRKAGYQNISILDPAHADHIDLSKIHHSFDIVVIAIKPQQAETVLPTLASYISPTTLVLSIMAGITINHISSWLNHQGPVVRAMPNTPAMIGAGMTVITYAKSTDTNSINTARALLTPLGLVTDLDDEGLMNAVTAVSGSGPAYVFYLIEVMAEAGRKQGLSSEMAMTLARETVIGSALLTQSQPTISASELRDQVTSKGGTTEAALNVLMKNNALQDLFDNAIKAATTRFQ